jgi:hypothetical protein
MNTPKAIPFIKYANNQFQVDPQAEQFLASLGPEKLGVVSIVGKYRTGKSFFVNKVLLGQQAGGFSVGPTINPCTKVLSIHKLGTLDMELNYSIIKCRISRYESYNH